MNRRLFLRSAAATVWLPLLPSALPRSAWAAGSPGPRRMVYWFVPNGLHWRALTPGADAWAENVLSPLQPMWERVSQVSGLRNLSASNYTSHEQATSSALTDVPINYSGGGSSLSAGVSVDQVAAEAIGNQTPAASLQLGLEEPGLLTNGSSQVYTNTISWGPGNRPLAKITEPRRLFNKIFAGSDPSATEENQDKRKSVLDAVLERATSMKQRLATDDKIKLEQYIDSVREVERQIEALEDFTCELPDSPPARNLPFHLAYRAMADLTVLAFHCDYTRIVTFMTGPSATYTTYNHLGHSEDHHTLSHATYSDGMARFMDIHKWHVQEMATTLQMMADIPEGDGDMLSNTNFTLMAEFGDPNVHNPHVMTWLSAGGENGGFSHGRHIVANQPHSNYHRALLQFMGAGGGDFGAYSTGTLDLT